jgi:glutathione synthase/RimK-type ligase-like ATP-grasp enzyme
MNGSSMRSMLQAREAVAVKTSSSDNRREHNETVLTPLHPQLVAQAAQAAERLGRRLASVDVVSQDPTRRLEENGGVIIELNCTPGLACHYHVREQPTRVAVPVLRQLLEPSPAWSTRSPPDSLRQDLASPRFAHERG